MTKHRLIISLLFVLCSIALFCNLPGPKLDTPTDDAANSKPNSLNGSAAIKGSVIGLNISGFQPGLTADEIISSYPGMFEWNGTHRLISKRVALQLDDEKKVIYVEGAPGAKIQQGQEVLFNREANYYRAIEILERTPNISTTTKSDSRTEVEGNGLVLRLEQRCDTSPLANKGYLASLILYAREKK